MDTGDFLVAIHPSCNYEVNPIGVDSKEPLFSWRLSHDAYTQSAYHIVVFTMEDHVNTPFREVWDSGKIESTQSVLIPYRGEGLHSDQLYGWRVKLYGTYGESGPWSEIATFRTGLLYSEDWKARWITSPSKWMTEKRETAPYFRKTFELLDDAASARVYVCGLGYYEMYINGRKYGDAVLHPPFTRYDETAIYSAYDITNLLQHGPNTIGIILGNGMYNMPTVNAWNFDKAPWRDNPKLLLQVNITSKQGQETIWISDGSWKVSDGPIRRDNLYDGEIYDARLELESWSGNEFNDTSWGYVRVTPGPGGLLRSMQMETCRITDVFEPVKYWEVRPGTWVYDMGRNIAGWARLKVAGPEGTEITLRFAEKLNSDGNDIDQSNIDVYVETDRFQQDSYILSGNGEEVWQPRFVYHGFQYVQVSGIPYIPKPDSIQGCFVHTDFPSRGQFSSSNSLINWIQEACRLSALGNYHGIPTDCPQREKNGWTGDTWVAVEQVLFNFHPARAYRKWLQDIVDAQRPNGQLPGIVPTAGWGYGLGGPPWDSILLFLPWRLYEFYGDRQILEEMYEPMKRYMNFMGSMEQDRILNFGLGDWCPPNGEPHDYQCPATVTDTGFYYADAVIMTQVANVLNRSEDVRYYLQLSEEIKEAFIHKFVNVESGIVTGNCQTSMACALYFNLVNGQVRKKVEEALISEVERKCRHIDCGILGTKFVLHALTAAGRTDLAYEMVIQTDFPGWGYWMSRGATTLWETWRGDFSLNHQMFSDVSAWFYQALAGINPDPSNPGFKHTILKPHPPVGLERVDASHVSMYGTIRSSWEIVNEEFHWKIEIPPNTSATLHMPLEYSNEVYVNGEYWGSVYTIHVSAGLYELSSCK